MTDVTARTGRAQVLEIAAGRPARELPEFFEHAARVLAAGGRERDAAHFFDRARAVEAAHERLLGLAPDPARAHRVLVELVPTGAITPTALHEHLRRLLLHPDPRQAHAWAREAVGAFLDAGTVPYPNVVADLLPLAEAAGVAKGDEESHLAERLLRGGLLPSAALPVWEALRGALARLGSSDPELLDLLIAATPAEGLYADAETTAAHRRMWSELLADADAGARLSRDWFLTAGPLSHRAMLRLAEQAGERLFPPPAGPFDPSGDPVAAVAAPDPLAFRTRNTSWRDDKTPRWRPDTDFAALAEPVETDPAARRRFADDLDMYVLKLGYYANVDYPEVLRRLCGHRVLRAVLDEQVATWKAEAAAGDLLGLEIALPRLRPLAEAHHTGVLDDLAPVDPLEAALTALRTGLPEELRFPLADPADPADRAVTVAQHRDLLTVGHDSAVVVVHGPEGQRLRAEAPFPAGTIPWHDGEHAYVSRWWAGGRHTYRVAGDGMLALDADTLQRWPEAPTAAEVTFPGAAAPVLVTLRDGMLRLTDADGRLVGRLRFSPVQHMAQLTPPAGWWPHLRPVDPDGSAALRHLDLATVRGLVDAALHGPKALAAELARALPEVTDGRLRTGVETVLTRAADCLVEVLRLRDALGLDHPVEPPPSVRSDPRLRPGRVVERLVGIRSLTTTLREATESSPALDSAHPVGTIELPRGSGGVYFALGELGAKALEASWAWTPEIERARILDELRTWANTPWGDGSGRWRKLSYQSLAGNHMKPAGEVWRTPNGALVILHFQPSPYTEAIAVEYSPDGVFRPFTFPGWEFRRPPVVQGWGGADTIARFTELLAERGPAPVPLDAPREIAERTGLPLYEAASACFGYPFTVGREATLGAMAAEVSALYDDPATGERPAKKSPRSYRLDREMRELLMPDDPEDLWTRGLAIDRAVAWWQAQTDTSEDQHG
ncbi:MAG TPA: hypothetical protein VHJ17_16390 [Thermomonospora sp.]|nr:hypothetical protein [Thermomonospora sp.]